MPKKAVALFFLLAFIGAGLFTYFTFPRTKDEIPKSNNQQPILPTPGPNTPNVPHGVPVPENAPAPNAPKVPPGPTLHVMAWATAAEAKRLSAATDAFAAATGRQVALTLEADPTSYRRDLQQAFVTGETPDLCLVSSRDFSGLDPVEDLDDISPLDDVPPRASAAFTVNGKLKAVPEEFSVEVLFYNPALFDQAGIAYPGSHWNWDMLEADTRALSSLNLKDATGKPTFAIELPATFDLWNILCAEAGAPALDLDAWRLADITTKDAQMRALQVLRDLFQEYAITPPLTKNPTPLGQYFAERRASLLIASSDVAATFPSSLHYGMTVLPRDLKLATLASVNGWAVPAKSAQGDAALALAQYLAYRPVHAGWSSIQPPPGDADEDSPAAVCHAALAQALVPRLDASTTHMAQFLDQQLNQLAHNPAQTPEVLYAKIQAELQNPSSPPEVRGEAPLSPGLLPAPKAEASTQLRGL
ncbi:MAG TPA: extracellular solute-binding protein [Candidatus Methylacidiphilales bacterium]|nr:extracellular solute-binding protein [Candidatus Methylacidiphilales bacterium]